MARCLAWVAAHLELEHLAENDFEQLRNANGVTRRREDERRFHGLGEAPRLRSDAVG